MPIAVKVEAELKSKSIVLDYHVPIFCLPLGSSHAQQIAKECAVAVLLREAMHSCLPLYCRQLCSCNKAVFPTLFCLRAVLFQARA